MEHSFNPYHEWLGLDAKQSAPNFYQLLGLENSVTEAEIISTAADRAMSRVRSFKPGKNAPLWARLLDELENAKNCLLDPAKKSSYDTDLFAGKPTPQPESDRPASRTNSADLQFKSTAANLSSLMYPPGFGDIASSVSSPSSPQSPMLPAPSTSAAPTYQPFDPMAPVAPAAFAPPTPSPAPYASPYSSPYAAPISTPYASPHSPTPAPVAVAPNRSYGSAYDPMAPVAMPVAAPAAIPVANSASAYPHTTNTYSPAMPQALTPMSPRAAPVMAGLPLAGYAAVPASVPVAQLVSSAEYAQSPVATAVPMGGGVSYPAAQASPLLAATYASASAAPAATPAAATPAVRSTSIRSQLFAERSRTATQTPIILGVGGGLVLLTVFIIYATVGGKKKSNDAAMNMPPKSSPTVDHSDGKHGAKINRKTPQSEMRNPAKPKPAPVTVTNIPIPPNDMTNDDVPAPRKKPGIPNESPESTSNPDRNPNPNPKPPTPETPEKPSETPEPKPESKPEPKSELKPEPEPKPVVPVTPTPEKPPEKPMPEKPVPTPTAQPQPTKEQVHLLAEALKNARAALGDADPDEASRLLGSVEALPKLTDHQAKYERLKQLTHYIHEFQMGYNEAVKGLEVSGTIQIGSTFVGVVETFPGQDKIILRVAGQNRTYRFRDLPVGLAVAIADRWLTKDDGTTHLVKGAFVAVHRKSSAEMINKARDWWGKAERDLPEVVKILRPVLNDTYDLEKDLPAAPPAS